MDKVKANIGRIYTKSAVTSFEWSIRSYFSLSQAAGTSYLSNDFPFMEEKYQLFIWPFGKKETLYSSQTVLGIVKCKTLLSTPPISYKIGIKKRDGKVLETFSGVMEFKDGKESLILHAIPPLLRYKNIDNDYIAPDGSLLVFLDLQTVSDVGVTEASCQTEALQGLLKLGQDLKELFLSEKEADIILNVKDRPFKALKAILGARSQVFAAMMEHDMREKNSGVIEITDCEPESFKDFLIYLYTGAVEELSQSNVLDLYKAADKYDVKDLKEDCVEFMKSNLSVDSFCEIVRLAFQHDESELLKKATEFFSHNLGTIVVSAAWQTFLKNNPIEGNELYIKSLQHHGVL